MALLTAENSSKHEHLGAAGSDADGREMRLRCPRCAIDLSNAVCPECGQDLNARNGIVCAITPQRAIHYARFIADYELIRAQEGRSSAEEDYYCNLPYQDTTGHHSGPWRIRARSFDALIRDVLLPNVRRGGRILDLGAGNCWMSFRLALAGYFPSAVDLLTNPQDGLGAAMHYRNYLPQLFPRFQAELTRLPFQSGQFDAAIFNASFHYSEDAEGALREALRCIHTGGLVVINDTPWYRHDRSGQQMVAERRGMFRQLYGTASDSLRSLEYLTDERLHQFADRAAVNWTVRTPWFGVRWALRPLMARLRRRREPSRFRVYIARKTA